MGKKGQSSGLKRKPAPRFWPIHRKESVWVVKPASGPHSLKDCMPLTVLLRDVLGFADTRKEASTIVAQSKILVDGKGRRNDNFPVGLMDVISMPDLAKNFRVLPSYKGLVLNEINNEEAKFKLCRIEDKTVVNHGHIQLHLHDGSNLLIKVADAKDPKEDTFETLDTLQVSVPEKQVLEHIGMKEKCFVVITGGQNIGKHGRIVDIEKAEGKKRKSALVTIEDDRGNRCQTVLGFVFVLGEAKPLISLAEAT